MFCFVLFGSWGHLNGAVDRTAGPLHAPVTVAAAEESERERKGRGRAGAALPGVVVYSDVAACHDGVSEEDQRLQRLCDGLWRGCLAVDSVVAWAHCTD